MKLLLSSDGFIVGDKIHLQPQIPNGWKYYKKEIVDYYSKNINYITPSGLLINRYFDFYNNNTPSGLTNKIEI